MKKLMMGTMFSMLVLSSISCAPRSKAMKAIEGKEGIFAIMDTSKGEICLELFYKKTPLTVANFVGLAEGKFDAAKGKPFYDGLTFHRVISIANGDDSNFMIQGGDPAGNGTGGPGYKFADEFVDDLTFDAPGKLAMANSGSNTNGSQFFITIVPTEWLTGKHTIFGEVVTGQEIVNKMKTNDVIKSVKIIRQGAEAQAFDASQTAFDKLCAEVEKAQKEAEEKAFAELTDGCTKTASGVYYKVVEEGKGSKIGKGKKVTADYIGYLPSGQAFDASKGFHPKGHEPLEFNAGGGDMIPGFDEMVQDMKVGETRTMIIPPELAYGAYGIPQAGIPGNSYICFTVKVISAK